MNIIGKKNIYFLISLLVLIPGLISLWIYGLKLSIDFTGGTRLEYQLQDKVAQIAPDVLRKSIEQEQIAVASIQLSGADRVIVRTKPLDQKSHQRLVAKLSSQFVNLKEVSIETVGPTIGGETRTNAVKAVFIASIIIVLYVAWSFRKVPKPASSIRFGICAIIALLHDLLVVVGIFSLLGHFYGVEVDTLFVTAILTVLGFSVHDTIVVFDRIRENLRRMPGIKFDQIVNDSIVQTLGRSLNTSLTTILVLFTLFLFGGESIKWFVVALLLGITSGTYSSIFNAAPLLVVWEEWSSRKIK